jgi:T4 RnlA family RNA ligase
METFLQRALRSGETPASIEGMTFVKSKRHPKYPNLVMFKYDMINSPMNNPLVQECRGIILDEAKNWEVVARPFDKFFNYGEGHAAEIDWSTAKVQEKLDGSLMIMYWHDGMWQIASSGLPDAGGAINNYTTTFAELFWKTWNDNGYELPDYSYQNFTFMFEMMTPYNRVVVPHKECKLTLIGIRHKDGHEMPVDAFAGQDWPYVKAFPLQTMEDVVASFDKFDGIDQEGYVVVDGNYNRVKVKHPGYVAIHHLKGDDGPSHKKMFKIVCAGESSEVLTYFPEWKPVYDEVAQIFKETLAELAAQYVEITRATELMFPVGVATTPARVQKEFAAMAVKTKCPDALFKMRAGKVKTFNEYFANIGVEHCMKIMGKREWTI